MHLLLTRPKSDDDPLPALLRARGHSVSIDPLLRIDALPPPDIDLSQLQAVAVTSSNALRVLRGGPLHARILHLPVYAVGGGTAGTARLMGFNDVRHGEGTARGLIPDLVAGLAANQGSVLYLRGENVAADLAPPLLAASVSVISAIVYRAVPAKTFAVETIAGLVRGSIEGTVLLSPRSAEAYADLAEAAGLGRELAHIRHYCLSDRVAAALTTCGEIPVRIPLRPNLQELVALIDLDATHS